MIEKIEEISDNMDDFVVKHLPRVWQHRLEILFKGSLTFSFIAIFLIITSTIIFNFSNPKLKLEKQVGLIQQSHHTIEENLRLLTKIEFNNDIENNEKKIQNWCNEYILKLAKTITPGYIVEEPDRLFGSPLFRTRIEIRDELFNGFIPYVPFYEKTESLDTWPQSYGFFYDEVLDWVLANHQTQREGNIDFTKLQAETKNFLFKAEEMRDIISHQHQNVHQSSLSQLRKLKEFDYWFDNQVLLYKSLFFIISIAVFGLTTAAWLTGVLNTLILRNAPKTRFGLESWTLIGAVFLYLVLILLFYSFLCLVLLYAGPFTFKGLATGKHDFLLITSNLYISASIFLIGLLLFFDRLEIRKHYLRNLWRYGWIPTLCLLMLASLITIHLSWFTTFLILVTIYIISISIIAVFAPKMEKTIYNYSIFIATLYPSAIPAMSYRGSYGLENSTTMADFRLLSFSNVIEGPIHPLSFFIITLFSAGLLSVSSLAINMYGYDPEQA